MIEKTMRFLINMIRKILFASGYGGTLGNRKIERECQHVNISKRKNAVLASKKYIRSSDLIEKKNSKIN